MSEVKDKNEDKSEDRSISQLCGLSAPFKIGSEATKLHPIRLKDWLEFNKYINILELETLYEIHLFNDGYETMVGALKMICREEEFPEFLNDMTQLDYMRLRSIVLEQNDIDFKKIEEERKKKLAELKLQIEENRPSA